MIGKVKVSDGGPGDEPDADLKDKLDALDRAFPELFYHKWRHKKTGGLYRIRQLGLIESGAVPAAIYECERTGVVWVRPLAEFTDGRFEKAD